jgi:ATP-dependent DNA helicase RecQ
MRKLKTVSDAIDLKALLLRHFGHETFRPGQEAVIQALMEHRAALAVFPTGGGKSLCYQLPALTFEGVTLVVSPLIALMKDQIDFLRRQGVAAARIDSSLSAREIHQVGEQMAAGTLQLLYVAPERFNNERFLGLLQRTRIALFAVDEAHCISEWGHNFRPDYLKLAETARTLGAERVLALTATATPAVVADICTAFHIPGEAAIVTGFYRPNLNLATTPVRAEDRDALLLKRLQSRPPGPTILYVTLQKTAERLAATLVQAGYEARAYHAGMESEDRHETQEWWMGGERRIVVATIAFGMGIDKADVRYVYHYNLPKSLESYSQEIGRAGRDGAKSTVEMLACPEDLSTLENFAYGDTPTENALHSLLSEILNGEPELSLNLIELGNRHDLRPLVLRTILTYLELRGSLRQGTPYYSGYAFRPLVAREEIEAQFKGEPARLVADLFAHSDKGRTRAAIWHRLNPDEMAAKIGQERKRIVRALEVLEERGLIELTASDVRQRYVVLPGGSPPETILAELMERFARREAQEIRRLQEVLALVTHDGCQVNALVAHFGEIRTAPCGHCTHCMTGKAQRMPSATPSAPLPAGLDPEALQQKRAARPDALREARQMARFLCGLSSPALSRARLTRDPLFGALDAYPFADVLHWCEQT